MSELVNNALKELSFLPGQWDLELSNAPFIESGTSNMDVEFAVIENGAFIAMRQGEDASWVIGRDGGKNYTIIYYDNRNVSRIYEMDFDGATWKIWRNTPEFSQRYFAKVSPDRKTITAYWEKSTDAGKTWQHDFDMKFVKKT